MDITMESLREVVTDIKVHNQTILKRLNDYTSTRQACPCNSKAQDTIQEIRDISQTLNRLQLKDRDQSSTMRDIENQILSLQRQQTKLQSQLPVLTQLDTSVREEDPVDESGTTTLFEPLGNHARVGIPANKSHLDGTLEQLETPTSETDPTDLESFARDSLSADGFDDIETASVSNTNNYVHGVSNTLLQNSATMTIEENPDDISFVNDYKRPVTGHEDDCSAESDIKASSSSIQRALSNVTPSSGLETEGHQSESENSDGSVTRPSSQMIMSNMRLLQKKDGHQDLQQDTTKASRVVAIKQTDRKEINPSVWHVRADLEMISAHQTSLKYLGGMHTVLLLDISESMSGAWNEVTTFFNDYVDGLENISPKGVYVEHVALVTFGHETRVQLRLTNKYDLLRNTFASLRLGGPSPLNGGFCLAQAAARSSTVTLKHGTSSYNIMHRMVTITDGHATEPVLEMGPDIVDPEQIHETRSCLQSDMIRARDNEFDMVFVPVGNANMETIEQMRKTSIGTILTYRDGHRLSRRTLLCFATDTGNGPGLNLIDPSTEDKEDIADIKANFKLVKEWDSMRTDAYQERADDILPPPGSRVRRGPEWRNGMQDQGMPGTITGHNLYDEGVWVQWDNNESTPYEYSYGYCGKYDVLLVDEPVILRQGIMFAVGCKVEPGPGWKDDYFPETKGTILNLYADEENIPLALVRWTKETRGSYTYFTDENSLPEVTVCSTGEALASGALVGSISTKRRRKNKNFN